MNRKWLCSLVMVAACVYATPVADAQNREHQQLAADVRMLQEQSQQLANTLGALTEALKALTARLDESTASTRKGFADQKLLIDGIADDVRVVRERTDDNNVRIATLREELEALRTSVVELQQSVVAAASAALTPAVPDPAKPGETPVVPAQPSVPPITLPSTAGLSPTRMFETARTDYFNNQYSLAITGFEQFLKAFPRSDMAGEAQLYIGESHANASRWNEAIAAYNLVVQNYPNSPSVPEAYYKRGMAQERIGQADAARASWETVVKSFPGSAPATLAKQNLDRLSRQRPSQ